MGANSIQAGNDLKIGNVTSSKNDYKLISFFARAHYSYDERYMITATMRRDGSSKFGANLNGDGSRLYLLLGVFLKRPLCRISVG